MQRRRWGGAFLWAQATFKGADRKGLFEEVTLELEPEQWETGEES